MVAWDIGRESKEIKNRSEHPVREEDRITTIIQCHMCLAELLMPRKEYLNLTGERKAAQKNNIGGGSKKDEHWLRD